jgi:hypothetical protein
MDPVNSTLNAQLDSKSEDKKVRSTLNQIQNSREVTETQSPGIDGVCDFTHSYEGLSAFLAFEFEMAFFTTWEWKLSAPQYIHEV